MGIEVIDGTIRGKIRGETRLDDDGVPVVWDLVMTSEDSYRWERADWAALMGGTEEIERCDGGITEQYRAAFTDTARATAGYATVQAFAVFAPIISGATLFLLVGAVLVVTGFVVDRGRRHLVATLEGGAS